MDLPRLRRPDAGDRGAVRRLKLLLDTHVALWWFRDPSLIDDAARGAIGEPSNKVLVSAASVWEASIKVERGRLVLPRPITEDAGAAGFEELPIRFRHALRAGWLPTHHRDPFDRMLIAQALDEDLILVTRDPLVRRYDVPTLLA